MPHAMTEDHAHDDADGRYRAAIAPTGAASRRQSAEAELRLVKSIGDAVPAAPSRSAKRIKRRK